MTAHNTRRIFWTLYLAAIAAAVVSLAGCGGGGGVSDSLEDEQGLIAAQTRRYTAIQAGPVTPEMVTEFNNGALVLAGMNISMNFHCGTQKGRPVAYADCVGRINTLRTPL